MVSFFRRVYFISDDDALIKAGMLMKKNLHKQGLRIVWLRWVLARFTFGDQAHEA